MNTQQLPQLGIGEALTAACNKIIQFNGRSRRSEFWWTILVIAIINALTQGTIAWLTQLLMIPITFRRLHDTGRSGWWWGAGIIATYVLGIIFVIDLGIGAMTGAFADLSPAMLSMAFGKWALIGIAYAAYHVVMLVFLCQDSEPHYNRYGESPKYIDNDDAKIECLANDTTASRLNTSTTQLTRPHRLP